MSSTEISFENLRKLPALEKWNCDQELTLKYEFGVWGKYKGTTQDYGMIASTSSFFMIDDDKAKRFYIGVSDEVEKSPTFMWKPVGKVAYVASICLTNRRDAKNRISTQTIVIQSDITLDKIPAPIQALFLISIVEDMQNTDHILSKLVGIDLDKETVTSSVLNISPEHHKPLKLSKENIINAFERGLNYLQSNYTESHIAKFYEQLLEGGEPALFSDKTHYPSEVVAVLLSFLPINMANSFSILENLPSTRSDKKKIADNWAAILSNKYWIKGEQKISANVKRESETIASKLMSLDLTITEEKEVIAETEAIEPETYKPNITDDNVKLTVWGPTASGKTVFLAQLYLEGPRHDPNWQVRILSPQTREFMDSMRKNMRINNQFPVATNAVHTDDVELALINTKEAINAHLFMQDRAGGHYTDLGDDILTILKQSDGLLLLFDPTREKAELEDEVWNTLQTLQMESSAGQEKITKPVAVCLSKADDYINSLDDFNFAIDDPDTFVRSYADVKLLELLDTFCENYTLFPVSSVGMKISRSHVEPVVFYDDQLNSRIIPDDDVQSINLLSPFIWLINNTKH